MAMKLSGGYEQAAERIPLRGYLYAIRQEIGNANIRFDQQSGDIIMANSRRRVNSRSESYNRQMYIEGSAVRKLNTQPEREQPARKKQRKVSRTTQKNRAKATQMSSGYVVFLTVTSVITLFLCVYFVQLKAQLTTQTQSIAKQESALSTLKADNDALYNAVVASVDLEHVKDVATNELGMKYPSEEQIIQFDTAGSSYVRQYQDVPGMK